MAKSPNDLGPEDGDETVPGIRYLRQLWGIAKEPKSQDVPLGDVNTDIYSTPSTKNIPPRRRPSS